MGLFSDGAYQQSGMFRDKVDVPESRQRTQVQSDLYTPDLERGYDSRRRPQFYDPTPTYMQIGGRPNDEMSNGYYIGREANNKAVREQEKNLGGKDGWLPGVEAFSVMNGISSNNTQLYFILFLFFVVIIAFQYLMLSNMKEYIHMVLTLKQDLRS